MELASKFPVAVVILVLLCINPASCVDLKNVKKENQSESVNNTSSTTKEMETTSTPEESTTEVPVQSLEEKLAEVNIDFSDGSLTQRLKEIMNDTTDPWDKRIEIFFSRKWPEIRAQMNTTDLIELGLSLVRDVIVTTMAKMNGVTDVSPLAPPLEHKDKNSEWRILRAGKSVMDLDGLESAVNAASDSGVLIHMMFKTDSEEYPLPFVTVMTSEQPTNDHVLSMKWRNGTNFVTCGFPSHGIFVNETCSQSARACGCPLSPARRSPYFYTVMRKTWEKYINESSNALDFIQRVRMMQNRTLLPGVNEMEHYLGVTLSHFLGVADTEGKSDLTQLVGFLFSELLEPNIRPGNSPDEVLEFAKKLILDSPTTGFPEMVLKLPTLEVSITRNQYSRLSNSTVRINETKTLLHIEPKLETDKFKSLSESFRRVVWAEAAANGSSKTVSFPLEIGQDLKIPVCATFETKTPSFGVLTRYTDTHVVCSVNHGNWIGIIDKEPTDPPPIVFGRNPLEAVRSLTALYGKLGGSELKFFDSRLLNDSKDIINREFNEGAIRLLYGEIILQALESAGNLDSIDKIFRHSFEFIPKQEEVNISIFRGADGLALSHSQSSLHFTTVTSSREPDRPVLHIELKWRNLAEYQGPLVLVNSNSQDGLKNISFRVEPSQGKLVYVCGNLDSREFSDNDCNTLSFGGRIDCICEDKSLVGIKQVPFKNAIDKIYGLSQLTQIGSLIIDRDPGNFVQGYKPAIENALNRHLRGRTKNELDNLVTNVLLPALHVSADSFEEWDRVLELLLRIIKERGPETPQPRARGLYFRVMNLTQSQLESTSLSIHAEGSEESLSIHLEIDTSYFPKVFKVKNLISDLVAIESDNQTSFDVTFEMKAAIAPGTALPSCFSLYKGNPTEKKCDTYSFSQQILCKCAPARYIGVRHQDFGTVLSGLKHVEQLTTLLETVRERSGGKRKMYDEFSGILSKVVQILESTSGTQRMHEATHLINFAQVTNEIFDVIFGNVKTIRSALEEIQTLRGAYEKFLRFGVASKEVKFFEGSSLSIAVNHRDGTSFRGTSMQFADGVPGSDARRFAHVVFDESLWRNLFLPQSPDAERPLTNSIFVIEHNDIHQSKTVTPFKLVFFNVSHPAEAGIKCGVVREEGFNRKVCETKLESMHDQTAFNVSCSCTGAGPYAVLATPIDMLMEETETLGGLLDFSSLVQPKKKLDLIWQNQRTLLERLNHLLQEASPSEILEAFADMFELSMSEAEDNLKMFALLESSEKTVRKRLEDGSGERTFSARGPSRKSGGSIAEFPSMTVMDVDGAVNGTIWLYNEFEKTHPVYKKLIELVDGSELKPCSSLVNVYADFSRANVKISTTRKADANQELRCARLDFRSHDTRKLFRMEGCRTILLTKGFLQCDCAAPGPYIVFRTPRDKLFEMETNATAVVALAEHFVRQHGAIGPIQESRASFLARLRKISAYSSDSGADEAIRMISGRLLPEILYTSSEKTHEMMMSFSRDSVLMLSEYLTAPVNNSNSPMALYVRKVSNTNLTVPLGSISVSYQGGNNDYTLFRELPRKYVSYLDDELVSDVVDIWTQAESKLEPTLDLTFELNPRFRRTKHLPRCVQFLPSGPHYCLTLEISNNIVCRCEGRGAFGVVMREHSQIVERFREVETMIRDNKWILSESLDSLIEVQDNFVQGLRNWRKQVPPEGYRQEGPRSAFLDPVFEGLYGELLPASLEKAKNIANLSAVLDFFRHSSLALLENGEPLQKYLDRGLPPDFLPFESSSSSNILMSRSNDGTLLVRNIPVAEMERFGLNNGSVTLTTDLREIVVVKPGARIVANFTSFRRIRHGDVKCVRFDTGNRYFDATGCEIQNRTETDLTCVCDRPGAVAVIVVPFESVYALNIFSAIAIAVDIFCLVVCVVILYHVPNNHSLRSLFRFHQCAALLSGQAVLIASTITVQSAPVFEPCNALVGFLLQFCFLVAAVFVGFEAIEALKQTYLISQNPATSGRKRFIFLGYGIPLLISTVSFGLNSIYIGSYQLCLVEYSQFLIWISAIPFVVVVGLCLIAAAAALLRSACLSEDRRKAHAAKLRSYFTSTTLLATIITLQWTPGHLVQIEGTGLIMSFLFFFATLIQGPVLLLLFIVSERDDRSAMARGLANQETKITKMLADMVRPAVVGGKVTDAQPRERYLREPSPSISSESITRISPIELRRFSEAPVV